MKALHRLLLLSMPWFVFGMAYGESSAIRLGQTLPLTGSVSELGTEYRAGIVSYFNFINSRGGIYGRNIELVSLDDGYDAKRSMDNTKKLAADKSVLALVGMFGTANYEAALPVINAERIPSLGPYTGSDELRKQISPTTFWVRASYGDEIEKIINQMTTLGVKRIAVLYQNDSSGRTGLASVEKSLAKRSLSIAAKGAFDRVNNELNDAVKTISSSNPQGVLMIGTYKPVAAFVQKMRQIGQFPQFFALSVVGINALKKEIGISAKGVAISQVVPFPWSEASPISREFLKMPKELLPKEGATYTMLEGYIVAKIMVEALRRSGADLSREKIIRSLETLKQFDVGGILVDYTNGNRMGSSFVELTIIGSNGNLMR